MNIIFVCTGNTCRSPMAQGYLESKKIPWLNVISRGIYADGSAVSVNSADAMAEIGIDIKKHSSAPLTKEDINWADRIICLSPNHYNILYSIGIGSKKLSVLGEGISDPFGCDLSVYRQCRDEIIEAAEILMKYDGYIQREQQTAEKIRRLEGIKISDKFDYSTITALSTEARQKLQKLQPVTIAQASRIPGVSPADINILLLLLGR